MANAYTIFEFLENDYAGAIIARKRRRLRLRVEYDPFDLDEKEFIKRYRLTKELARNLCEELRPLMKEPKRSTDLSIEIRVLIALSFYVTGSNQRPIGHNKGHFVAQQTVSKVISEVTACLNSPQMREKYIKFPGNSQECNRNKTEFYKKTQIPGVLGCIDCTQVAIMRPAQADERYFCPKQYFSLNVQLICDADMQIINVDASNGGATHDSVIWKTHPLRARMEDLSSAEDTWLLGDSGYYLRKTMMTPILDVETGSPEEHYNNLHANAMTIMERTIGQLKARFHCLLAHKPLHYTPEVAASIVHACVILYNICNSAKVPVQALNDEDLLREAHFQPQEDVSKNHTCRNNNALQQGLSTRNSLVKKLWEGRHVDPETQFPIHPEGVVRVD